MKTKEFWIKLLVTLLTTFVMWFCLWWVIGTILIFKNN